MGGGAGLEPNDPPEGGVEDEGSQWTTDENDGLLNINDGVFTGWSGDSSKSPEVITIPSDVVAINSTLYLGKSTKELIIPASVQSVVEMGQDGNYAPISPNHLCIECYGGSLDRITVDTGSSLFVTNNNGLYSLSDGCLLYIFGTKNMTEFTLDTSNISSNVRLSDLDFRNLEKLTINGSGESSYLGSDLVYANSTLTNLKELILNGVDYTDLNLSFQKLEKLNINLNSSNSVYINVNSQSLRNVNLGSNIYGATVINNCEQAINVSVTSDINSLDLFGSSYNVSFNYSQVAFEFNKKHEIFGIYKEDWNNLGYGIGADEDSYFLEYSGFTIKLNFMPTTAEERRAIQLLNSFSYSTSTGDLGEQKISLFDYSGNDTDLVIPEDILGYKVTSLTLYGHNIEKLTLPSTLTYFETNKNQPFKSITFTGTKKQLEGIDNAEIFKKVVAKVSCSDGDYVLTASTMENRVYTYTKDGIRIDVKVDWQNNAIEVVCDSTYKSHTIKDTPWDDDSDEYFYLNGVGVRVKFAYADPMGLNATPVISFDDFNSTIKASSDSAFTGTISHSYVDDSREESTCYTQGHVTKICSICNDRSCEDLPLRTHNVDKYGLCTYDDCDESIYYDICYDSSYGGYEIFHIYEAAADQTVLYIPSEYKGGAVKIVSELFYDDAHRTKVTDIVIPRSIVKMYSSFSDDEYALQNIWYEGSIEEWANVNFTSQVFAPLAYTKNFYVDSSASSNKLSGTLVSGNVVFGNDITSLSSYAFYGYTKITSVTIPNTVTSLGKQSFGANSNLQSLAILTSSCKTAQIADFVDGMDSLQSITCDAKYLSCIPTGVSSIYVCSSVGGGEVSFPYSRFDDLTSLTLGSYVTELSGYAKNATKLTDIYFVGSILDWMAIKFTSDSNPIGSYEQDLDKKLYVGASLDDMTLIDGTLDLTNATTINTNALMDYNKITKLIAPNSYSSYLIQSLLSKTTSIKEVHILADYLKELPNCVEKVVLVGKGVVIPERTISYDSSYDTTFNIHTIEGDIVEIGNYGLAGYAKLANIDLSKVEKIGSYALAKTKLTNVDLSSVTTSGSGIFVSVDTIENIKCTSDILLQLSSKNLKTAELVSGSEYMRLNGTYNSLVSLTLPSSLTTIYSLDAPNLAKIDFAGTADYWCEQITFKTLESVSASTFTLFGNNTKLYVKGEKEYLKDLDLASSTYTVKAHAFKNYKYLESVDISRLCYINEYAFYGCPSLVLNNLNFANSNIRTIGEYAFANCTTITTFSAPSDLTSLSEKAFGDAKTITSAKLHSDQLYILDSGIVETLTIVGKETTALSVVNYTKLTHLTVSSCNSVTAKNCPLLERIDVTDTLVALGKLDLDSLKTLTLPSTFRSSYYALPNTLKEFTFGGTIEDWLSVTFGNYIDPIKSNPTYYVGDLYLVGEGGKPSVVTSVSVPNTITKINDYAFVNCASLTSVEFGAVTSIGKYAFSKTSLNNFTLPNTLLTIDYDAFESCKNLTQVVIPNSVTSIGSGAFDGCKNITSFTTPFLGNSQNTELDDEKIMSAVLGSEGGPESFALIINDENLSAIPNNAFAGLNVTSITFPKICAITSIGTKAFYNTDITSITFGALTSIGDYAFGGCDKLTSVSLGKIGTVGNYAFKDCTSLTNLTLNTDCFGDFIVAGCTNMQKLTMQKDDKYDSGSFGAGPKIVEFAGNVATIVKSILFSSDATEVIIPSTVTSFVGTDTTKGVKINWQGTLSSWMVLTFDSGERNPLAGGNELYIGGQSVENITITSAVKQYTFYGCTNLKTVTFAGNDSDAYIAKYAFANSGVEKVYCPDYAFRCASIAEGVFSNCKNLVELHVPETNSLGGGLIGGCENVKILDIPYLAKNNSVLGLKSDNQCVYPEYLLNVNGNAGTQGRVLDCIFDLTIRGGIIKEYAFAEWPFLKTVTLGCAQLDSAENENAGKVYVKNHAFYNCTSLYRVDISRATMVDNGESKLVNMTFYQCPRILEVVYSSDELKLSNLEEIVGLKSALHFQNIVSNDSSLITTDDQGFVWYIRESNPWLLGVGATYTSEGDTVVLPEKYSDDCKTYSVYDYSFYMYGTDLNVSFEPSSDDYSIYIEDNAFFYSNFSNITIQNVKSIGARAFSWTRATNITLSGDNISVGKQAFSSCGLLENMTLDGTFANISDSMFYSCDKLSTLSFRSSTIESIGAEAFFDCKLLASIPNLGNVNSIGESAFSGCTLLSAIPVTGAKEIGDFAFFKCTSLTKFVIDGLSSLGTKVFAYDSDITYLEITNSSSYSAIDGGIVDSNNILVYGFGNTTIGNTITGIGNFAFFGINTLKNIALSSSVLSIGEGCFEDCISLTSATLSDGLQTIQSRAFANCSKLESIVVPSSVGNLGTEAFISSGLQSATINSSLSSCENVLATKMFSDCANLKNVILADGIKKIEQYAFSNCTSLPTIDLPAQLEEIEPYAFNNCVLFTSVIVPYSVELMGENVFAGCKNIVDLSIPFLGQKAEFVSENYSEGYYKLEYIFGFTPTQIKNLTITKSAMMTNWSVRNLSLDTLTFGEKVTEIKTYVYTFNGDPTVEKTGDTTIGKVYIDNINMWIKSSFESANANPLYAGNNVELYVKGQLFTSFNTNCSEYASISISDYAFAGYQYIESVILDKTTNVGEGAFTGCTNLTLISDPSKLAKIGASAFMNTRLSGNENVVLAPLSIGDYAFGAVSGIKTLVIKNDTSQSISIGLRAFADCKNITSVDLSGVGSATYGNGVFSGCSSVVSVSLSSSMTAIPSWMFQQCTSLTTITIPSSVKSIGDRAFSLDKKLSTVYYGGELADWIGITFEYDEGTLYYTNGSQNSMSSNPCIYGASLYLNEKHLQSFTLTTEYVLGNFAFAGCDITELTIDGISDRGGIGMFAWCQSLEKITKNSNGGLNYDYCFIGCSALKEITSSSEYDLIKDGVWYHIIPTLSEYTVVTTFGNNVVFDNGIGIRSFAAGAFYNAKDQALDITISKSNVSFTIGAGAFYGCTNFNFTINISNVHGYLEYYTSASIYQKVEISAKEEGDITSEQWIEYLTTYHYSSISLKYWDAVI